MAFYPVKFHKNGEVGKKQKILFLPGERVDNKRQREVPMRACR